MAKFVKKVAEFEINAREKLSYENPLLLEDKFSRAKALLASCRLIDTSEALATLSYIRFMADMSTDPRAGEFIEDIDAVAMSVKPAHLTASSGLRDADSQKRDALRASILNEFAKKYQIFELLFASLKFLESALNYAKNPICYDVSIRITVSNSREDKCNNSHQGHNRCLRWHAKKRKTSSTTTLAPNIYSWA